MTYSDDLLVAVVEAVDKALGKILMSEEFAHVNGEDAYELAALYLQLRRTGTTTQEAFNAIRKEYKR